MWHSSLTSCCVLYHYSLLYSLKHALIHSFMHVLSFIHSLTHLLCSALLSSVHSSGVLCSGVVWCWQLPKPAVDQVFLEDEQLALMLQVSE
jgi:hypothetical protein